jgi:hypothetical protein
VRQVCEGGLAWLGWHETRDAALSDVDTELEQLAMDPWRAPADVGLGHLADERLDLGGGALSAGLRERDFQRQKPRWTPSIRPAMDTCDPASWLPAEFPPTTGQHETFTQSWKARAGR